MACQNGTGTMADDTRIVNTFPAHPKTLKLERRLGTPACWSLVCLFLWTSGNKPEGNLTGMDDEDLALAAKWDGPATQFVKSLVEIGFLDGDPNAYRVHDWIEHNPYAASRPQRIESARKAAVERWKKKNGRSPAMRPDANRNTESCDPHQSAMPTPPHPTTTKVKSKSVGAFAPPTLAQVTAYCSERGNRVNPQQWMNHYEANGWKVGKNTMKNWKAAVKTWEGNGINGGRKDGKRTDTTTERSQKNKGTIIDVFTEDPSDRDAPDGFERQGHPRLSLGQGVPSRLRH